MATPVNNPPIVNGTSNLGRVDEDGSVFFGVSDLLRQSEDTEDDPLSVQDVTLDGPGQLSQITPELWKYETAPDDNTREIFIRYRVSDGIGTSGAKAVLVIDPINDAPTLADPLVRLDVTNEDTPSTELTVADLVDLAGWDDVDPGALKGLAITGSTGAGQWKYSTGGSNWTAIGTASPAEAVLLSATSLVRYEPDGKNADSASLTFRAWDQTTGTASAYEDPATANTAPSGGTTAFSDTLAVASLEVSAVNDAPTLGLSTFNLERTNEDTDTLGISVSELLDKAGWVDVDSGALQGMAVTELIGAGTWQYSTDAANWFNAPSSISNVRTMLVSATTQWRYLTDDKSGETASLSFVAWDRSDVDVGRVTEGENTLFKLFAPSGGTSAYSSIASTARLVVDSINDAPTLGQAEFNLPDTDEDTPANTSVTAMLALAGWADVDGVPAQGMAITGTSGQGDWEYSLDGSRWGQVSFVSERFAQLLDGTTLLRYVPDGDNGETAALHFRAWDRSTGIAATADFRSWVDSTSNGGSTAFSTAVSQASLLVTPVNDAPTTQEVVLGPIDEDSSAFTITQAMLLSEADDVDSPLSSLVASELELTSSLGILVNNGDGTWDYTPAPNDDTEVSFSFTISDGAPTPNEGTVDGIARLDLRPVNELPVAEPDSAQTGPATPVQIAVLANDSDPDGGTLRVNGAQAATHGSVSILAGGLIVHYTPAPGFSGYDSFSYTVADGQGGFDSATVQVLVASHLGGAGNDVLAGTPGADFILGLDGNDYLRGLGGADWIDGGKGNDFIIGGDGPDTTAGGEADDNFVVTGTELTGDQIDGGPGTDTLSLIGAVTLGPAGFDFTGIEQLYLSGSLTVQQTSLLDLSGLALIGPGGPINGNGANNRIIATQGNDLLHGGAGRDELHGSAGNDTVYGGTGSDSIHGGLGNDTLYGSGSTARDNARDTFYFDTALNATTNVDLILGFEAGGSDKIALDLAIFGAVAAGPSTGLDAGEFRVAVGGQAQDSDDFIVYDPSTGNLYYDADGSGSGARVQFATLGAGLTGVVDVTDFVVASFPG